MIDTGVSRISLTLKNQMLGDFPDPALPEGFSFVTYKDREKDALNWAKIMCSVGFSDQDIQKGIECFGKEFDSLIELAYTNMFFVKNSEGEYIGSCSAWIMDGKSRLHWLAVLPEYQQYGIGRALVDKVLYTFKTKHPGPVHLGTQTTSHRAICLYMKRGFYPIYFDEKSKADYEESVRVLKGVMREKDYELFKSSVKEEEP